MKTAKFRTQYTGEQHSGEVNKMPSLTVPDKAYTPAELLMRLQQGAHFPKLNNMTFDGYASRDNISGVPYFPDKRRLDFTEQAEMHERAAAIFKKLYDSAKEKENLRRKEAQERAQEYKNNMEYIKKMSAQGKSSEA